MARREYAVTKRHGYGAVERWERNAVSLIEYANFIAQRGWASDFALSSFLCLRRRLAPHSAR